MTTILFYSPFDQRSRDTESLMLAFKNQGHEVISLTQGSGNEINEFLTSRGIRAISHWIKGRKNVIHYLRHLSFLISFCRKNRIRVIYSHLEPANFVAVLAQFFIRAKVYIVRHHVEEAALQGFDRSVFYRVTYRMARKIIAVSNRAVTYMIEKEHIRPDRILHINLAYDFSLYPKPDSVASDSIKNANRAQVLLLTIGRLTKNKRPELAIETLEKVLDMGIDARLILLGAGEELDTLTEILTSRSLSDRVSMAGYVWNVADYMAAANFIIHPSITESSCVVVKEAGSNRVPVIVCRGVGDFEEYIVHGENGYLTDPEDFAREAADIIAKTHFDREQLMQMAGRLHDSITEVFSIERILPKYEALNNI